MECLAGCESAPEEQPQADEEPPQAKEDPPQAKEEPPLTQTMLENTPQESIRDPELQKALEDAELFEKVCLAPAAKKCTDEVAAAREGAGARVPLEGMEAKASQLEAALQGGDVEPRTGLGQKFAAWLKANPLEDEKYKALRAPGQTMAMKREFRLKWAQQELSTITTVKQTKLEQYQIVDEELGVYEPFDMVVKYEGGRKSPAAWRAAVNYCTKCMELGGMWLSWNAFTQRTDVLYIKKQRRSSFNQVWSLYQERLAERENEENVASATLTPVKTGSQPTSSQKEKRKECDEKVSAGDKDCTPSAKKKAKQSGSSAADKTNQRALRDAQILKSLYHKVNCMQQSKTTLITNDSSWACLRTDANIDQLKSMFAEVQAAASSEFETFFLNNDLSEVRRAYKDNHSGFFYKLQHMQKTLEPPLKALDGFHARLQRMYRASQA